MTCRACIHLVVPADARGRQIPRKGNVYRCLAPLPKLDLPVSVTTAFGFQWPPSRRSMEPDEGLGCPSAEPKRT
jgi:hypothetical protein